MVIIEDRLINLSLSFFIFTKYILNDTIYILNERRFNVIEKNNSVRISVTIPCLFLLKMKENATKKGMSLSCYIRYAVSELEKGNKQ